jgi:hypothetical protein
MRGLGFLMVIGPGKSDLDMISTLLIGVALRGELTVQRSMDDISIPSVNSRRDGKHSRTTNPELSDKLLIVPPSI